eukprot:5064810-Pleurochrysis_carterae.AAC.1
MPCAQAGAYVHVHPTHALTRARTHARTHARRHERTKSEAGRKMKEGRRETQAESSISLYRSKRKVGQEGSREDSQARMRTVSSHTRILPPHPPSLTLAIDPEPLSLTPLPASSPSK